MAILEVSHIEKHFGRTNVLKDVSFLHGGRHGACHYRIVRLRKDNASALSEFSGAPEWRNDYG